MSNHPIYSIPARFRRVENLHILFWLLKDAFWALSLAWPAIFMILPTMGAALLITWQARKIISELLHNLAILFWITANCTWMIGEFFKWDEQIYYLRKMALIPFSIGLLILGVYYFLYFFRSSFREKVSGQMNQILEKEKEKEKSRF
jgi:hypothetical protein